MGNYIKTLFYVLLIIVTCSIKETDAECSITSGGIYTFGPKCEYMCHCKYGKACDSVTGDCQNGCDKNWFGPGCQYRDLAESQVSRHLDNVPQYRWASRANDGDVTTCSETNYASTRRTKNPWWRVWFPNTETITSLEFLTTDEHLKYFKSFKVTIENIPERESTNAHYYPTSDQLCYQHSNDVPSGKKIYVTCDKPLKGNLVRIQLASLNTQLVLCDVRINGGRNMAFMKQVTRSSGADEDMYPPGNIVDGILRNDSWNDCFVTALSSSLREEWVAVNIGHLSSIKMVRITYYKFNSDNIRYYKLYVSNTTERSDAVIVHDDTSFIPTREITLDVTGRYVRVARQSLSQTVVCEMEIFGDCLFGKYGYNCDLDCSTHCEGGFSRCYHVNGTCLLGCEAGWEGELCDKECEPGNWGKNCQQHCGKCLFGTCDKVNGQCESGCAAGYKGTTYCTEECDNNTFGINCADKCSLNCQDVCDKANGKCDSCNAGWKGSNCTEECLAGTWGESCLDNCGMCLNGTCNKFNGKCTGGCKPGYQETDMCTQQCPAGSYGTGCSGVCSTNCKVSNTCNHEDGKCDSCKSGKHGDFCDQDCERGSYGEDCQQSCGACAMNETCDRVTGHCTQGCDRGYKHSLLCDTECDDGTHGDNCTKTCGNCKQGTFCDKVTGICLTGCAEGYKPGVCQEALKQDDDFPVGAVAGGVAAAVVVIIVVALVLVFLKRRRKPVEKRSESTLGFDADAVRGSLKKSESHERENVYINSINIEEKDINLTAPDDTAKYAESAVVPEPDEKRLSDRKTGVLIKIEDEGADIYYNEGPVSRRRTEHVVLVSELEEYVKKRVADKGGFTNEFEKLPTGLQHPTTVAKKVENMGKNRYKALYAYDHSRVKLKILPNLPDSDYINASLIKGYFKNDAYIASQGPTEFNIHEFWRMIWEKDVFTIVMVTRLVEETKMKCMQYWPEEGNTEEYGPVIVTTEAEDIYAESKIRRFNVSHQDEPGKSRKVTQFHYIAWPDKDVPRSTSSLLHFWYQVRKHDESKKHQWLVHCSAGVGRTGTFIALDLLYDQGIDQGCIDVFQCVKDLRDQRVNLVQTKEQYRYLYSILVEALVLPWKPIQFENIAAVYRDLQDVDNKTGKTKLFMEYETLLQETGSGNDLEEVDEMYTSAKHTENRNKNRYDNILAPNDYRPFLFTHVKGRTNYINAVYVPSYCDIHSYILTQTPLPETAIDCCRLALEQEVSAIVIFDESTSEEVGEFLPDSGTINVGPFTVSLVSEEDRAHYKMKQYKLHFDSKKHSFTQLVCKHWPPSQVIPTDPNRMLALLQELECIQRQEVNKPIVAQCLNGAERSGLIVVLMNILEHLRFHNEVSIPQIIRQLRIRRQQIIPNFEQYKFCYDVLLAHVENSTTYANV